MSDPSSSTAMASTSNAHDEEGVDYGDDMDDHDGDGRRAQEDMTDEDKELEAMKARVREMEAEAAKLREMQAVAEKERAAAQEGSVTPIEGGAAFPTEEEQQEIDARSIFVKNVCFKHVDFKATPEDVHAHFESCGTINRVTILNDKFTGHPKGHAYVEFADPELLQNAMLMNETTLLGRNIQVLPKRTNLPSFILNRGRGRGGYRGGRGSQRAAYHPYRGTRGRGRGRGRGY